MLVLQGKVLGLLCGGQTNRVELARRDGLHNSRRRTAATAGLSGTTGGQQKNGYSQIFGHVVVRGARGARRGGKDAARPAREHTRTPRGLQREGGGRDVPAQRGSVESVRYSDDDCTPDSDDECGDEDRRI